MFTGIIKSIGKVAEIKKTGDKTTLTIKKDGFFAEKEIGSSISINGVCLTITELDSEKASFDIMKETFSVTTMKEINVGDEVNMEPALSLNQGLDGHLVQGHVDATGKILQIKKDKGQTTMQIEYPNAFRGLLSLKGSIAVNGVSLTVSFLEKDFFEVCLVGHTIENTNLGKSKKNDKVNLEFDMIAKHVKSLLDAKSSETKYQFLVDRGFI